MREYEKEYLKLVHTVLNHGETREDRTGTGTKSIFGAQIKYHSATPLPILTTKKVNFNAILHELLWFISGSTNIKYLVDNKVYIWNEWTEAFRIGGRERVLEAAHNNELHLLELGPVYGKQWRNWEHSTLNMHQGMLNIRGKNIDQLKDAIQLLQDDPYSRRNIVTAWNVGQLPDMALMPCHAYFQLSVREGGRLDLHLYQRSVDIGCGLPYNMVSYALLNMMIAQITGLNPGMITHSMGDAHIYRNHIDGLDTQIQRKGFECCPTVLIDPSISDIDDFKFEDFKLEGYYHEPHINLPISI